MTFAKTRTQLSGLLADKENRVISLAGKWGTGKTHLIDDLVKNDPEAKGALYVSLFGLKNLDQVKGRLMEAATPLGDANEGFAEGLKQFAKAGWKAASEQFKALAALSDVNLLMMAPVMLRGKLIVVDDIERKHADLGMDELLGFIDDYSKRHNSRFVLVLNDDRLEVGHKLAWQTLHEKVVDRGLKLVTSPEEAFDIALVGQPMPYHDALKEASVVCELTNIRIIRQVNKVARLVLGAESVNEAVIARVVPPIVLFSAIHYRGLADGPDLSFALGVGQHFDWAAHEREKNGELTEEDKRAKRWRSLMYQLGIRHCTDFEFILVDFLESGLLNTVQVSEIIERYGMEHEALEVRERIQKFLRDSFWNHHLSETQLLADAEEFPNIAHMLDPYIATDLFKALTDLEGGSTIANQVKDAWIVAFKERSEPMEDMDGGRLGRNVHPEIEAAILASKDSTEPPTSDELIAAVLRIKEGGWNAKEEIVLRNARTADFDHVIRTLDVEVLPKFMQQMIKMHEHKTTYEKHFMAAMDRFMEACNLIAMDRTSPRLAKLVSMLIRKPTHAS